MGTLNIGAAASFGLFSQILYINSSLLGGQGTIDYSYGYVDASQLYNQVPLGATATETVQTASNVQAMQNLFNDPSSVNPGFILANGAYGEGDGTIATNSPVTSTMTVSTVPVPAGSYNVNLSTATQISDNPSVVAASSLDFVFIPGTTQSQSLTYSTGATISESVTNGITNTTTNAEGQTVALSETAATSVTGGVPGDSSTESASESAAISYAWSQTSSQSTNYSTTNTTQTNTTVSSTTTVNLNTATPNADGTYTYGAYTLVPGQTYVVQIVTSEAAWSAPVNQIFQIAGTQMTVEGYSYMDGDPFPTISILDGEQAINYANAAGYSLISDCDNSLFTYSTGETDYVNFAGLVTSTSAASVNATVVIQAVATTAAADNSGVTTSGSADGIYISAAPQATSSTAMLDLGLAATKLKANHGVYFNTATPGIESDLVSKYLEGNANNIITISGGDQDVVTLGNLNYDLTGFTHSNVTVGGGNNKIKVTSTENDNQFNFGNGNNNISLDGKGNNFYLGEGENYIEVTGGTGKNFIIDGTGSTALMINSETGFTQVSKWDQTQDSLHFGSNLNLSDVKVTFNYNDWSYNVFVKDSLVANLISVGGLSLSDPTTMITSTSAYAPTSMAIKSNVGFLTGLYADAFERAPDAAGSAYWENVMTNGGTRSQVAQSFFTSHEFESQYQTSSQYVTALYHDLLGRNPDANELDVMSSLIDDGLPNSVIVSGIINSTEFVQLVGVTHLV